MSGRNMSPSIPPRPVILCILDGWGYRADRADNGIEQAKTPNWHRLVASSPHALLQASELFVGLPEGQMGNSEVGHMNIGAGRVVLQDLVRVDQAVADGSLAKNPRLIAFIAALKASGGTAHLMGLMSPGGVHSHQDHIETLAALLDPGFAGFTRARTVRFAAATGMTEYSSDLKPFLTALFPPEDPTDTFGEAVARAGLRQLRIAETEKYAHVTFFFNGGREAPFPGEERILVPSPKVATYDLKPEMSAFEVTDRLVDAIEAGRFDVVVLNYANADMVGHSGDLGAAIKAVEAIDACLGRLSAASERAGGCILVTADHGNVEMMRDPQTGQPHTAHTTNPVPVMLVNPPPDVLALENGRLADIAPTLLALLGLKQPTAMTGRSLLRRAAVARADARVERRARS